MFKPILLAATILLASMSTSFGYEIIPSSPQPPAIYDGRQWVNPVWNGHVWYYPRSPKNVNPRYKCDTIFFLQHCYST